MRIILTLVVLIFGFTGCAGFGLAKKGDETILKSQNDQRQYRYVELDNGLKVMLVSDPTTDFSAASLDVYVGSGSDPKHRQGLAHFLEHMLFLGTEKYPDADDYMRFLKDNGGHHNAYTSFEHTNYFFDIKPDALEPTLDRFAQFFISPLLDEHYVEREKHAVHSEYKAGIKDESRRNLDAMRQVINIKHPFNQFSVGNLETLSSDKTPIRQDLTDFYQQYYVANNMALSVLGKESLDQLQRMVEQKFEAVRKKALPAKGITEPIFMPGFLPKKLYVQPEKKLRELTLLFPMPDQTTYYHSKPLDVIAHVLGHEGKGSLLSYLKKRNWVESLSASQALSYNGGTLFAIDMSLTEQGELQQEAILKAVFQAIERLQQEGMPKPVFDEIAKINTLEFDYQEKGSPQGYVLGIANNMHYYPAHDVLSAELLVDEYNPPLINQMLQQLTITNCMIVVVSDRFEPDMQTDYYHVPIKIEDISKDLLAELGSPPLNDEILLPQKNALLPDDLHVMKKHSLQDEPTLLVNKRGLQLWRKPVGNFQVPKATTYFSFRKEKVRATAKASVLLDTYIELLNDSFSEWVYPAHMAGLSFAFYPQMRGVTLKIDGFNDKQDELLNEAFGHIKNARFDEQQFTRIQATLLKDWENAEKQPPYKKLMSRWSESLQKPSWPTQQKIAVLQQLKLQDIQQYADTFWHHVDVLGMVNGNVSEQQSMQILSVVEAFIQQPVKAESDVAVVRLPVENLQTKIASDHDDSGYLLYWQGKDNDVKSQAQFMLLGKALESSFFNELRTEQQLGYVVYSSYAPLITVPGLAFVVQSPVASVAQVHQSVMAFLRDSEKELMAMSPDYLLQLQQALRQELLERPLSLVEESDSYWLDLALGYTNFDRKQQLASAIQVLSIEEWRAFIAALYQQPLSRMHLFSTESDVIGGFRPVDMRDGFGQQFFYYGDE